MTFGPGGKPRKEGKPTQPTTPGHFDATERIVCKCGRVFFYRAKLYELIPTECGLCRSGGYRRGFFGQPEKETPSGK